MITPQELQGKEFVKAVFGGYDMQAVDDYVEAIASDYGTLYKENAVLKSKLKVLVEKVEEYRNTEDSMRMTFLTAQKMGNEIIDKAKSKADIIVSEAKEQSKSRLDDINKQIQQEQQKLEEMQQISSEYSRRILKLYEKQIGYIQDVAELVIPGDLESAMKAAKKRTSGMAAGAVVPEKQVSPAKESDRDKPKVKDEPVKKEQPKPEAQAAREQAEPTKALDDAAEIARSISDSLGDSTQFEVDESKPWDDEGEPTTKRPKFDFDDLQFGRNLEDE